ncbi:MAG TPA: hypothetical protein VLL51_07070, partial [Gemmatimonadales bacterium]|nr:hypothetical protein [Gemmatimonadales bacterium]
VTPPGLVPWAKVSLIEASPFDTLTAYAAINTFRLDDLRAHIYRTRDGGRTWTHITSGIPDAGVVNAVREDPVRRGLLFAGTEREVYFSIDDGDHWQSLRLNMPATSIRDLVVKDDDLVAGTHGRSFWILDDLTPLRQLSQATAASPMTLFAPQRATRVRWNMNTDTPLPPDEPAGENPPDGAILNYWLGDGASGAVTLEILDSAGALVRRFSSTDEPEQPIPGQNISPLWFRPPQVLSGAPGMHRFVWDLRYPVPAGLSRGYPLAQIVGRTVPEPNGPAVPPGRYRVRLTAGDRAEEQGLVVRIDPRVTASSTDLLRKFLIEKQIAGWLEWQSGALAALRSRRGGGEADQLEQRLARLGSELNSVYRVVDEVDAAPTAEVERQYARLEGQVAELRARIR